MRETDLDNIARRPARYWHIDGLPELMIGVFWIVWGTTWLFGETLPRDWRWNAYWLVMPAVMAGSVFALNRLTRHLKERVTFPRAGYVALNEPGRATKAALAAFIVLAATLLVVFLGLSGAAVEQRAPAIFGVLLSLSFLAVAVRQRTPHHLVLAGAGLMLTLAIVQITSGWSSLNWLFVTLGTTCVAVGAVRLALFLRAHPRPAEGM